MLFAWLVLCTGSEMRVSAPNGHHLSGLDSNHRNQAALQDCEMCVACCVGELTWHSGSSAPLNRNMTGTAGSSSAGVASRLWANSSMTPTLLASSPAPGRQQQRQQMPLA